MGTVSREMARGIVPQGDRPLSRCCRTSHWTPDGTALNSRTAFEQVGHGLSSRSQATKSRVNPHGRFLANTRVCVYGVFQQMPQLTLDEQVHVIAGCRVLADDSEVSVEGRFERWCSSAVRAGPSMGECSEALGVIRGLSQNETAADNLGIALGIVAASRFPVP